MSKILIVEDDVSLRDVYSARLEAEGYQIAVASNGEEALATAVKERPDLILLDVMMPKISGFDVLDIIRTTPEIAHTRVIMMTALSAPEDKERGEKLGVDKYLVKSQVTLEEMVDAIKQVLVSASPAPTGGEQVLGNGGQRAATEAPAATQVAATGQPSVPQNPTTPPPAAPAENNAAAAASAAPEESPSTGTPQDNPLMPPANSPSDQTPGK
jgi:DNA-binding response OmpR family regulator